MAEIQYGRHKNTSMTKHKEISVIMLGQTIIELETKITIFIFIDQ